MNCASFRIDVLDVFYGILEKSLQLDLVEILKTSAALRHWKPE